ncbi:MAG: hypothetical protein PHO15_04460 [Eubacteriales bacterium]|nr:hypothetical protein [Eubacteriales bacterium]
MKKFLLVLLIVLFAIGVLAACAPLQNIDVAGYAHAVPVWVIIVGAIVLFFIGFGIIWKLIPGFIKVIALIVLAVAIAGVAYGLWQIPVVDELYDGAESYIEQQLDE